MSFFIESQPFINKYTDYYEKHFGKIEHDIPYNVICE